MNNQKALDLWQLALVKLEKEMIRPSFETWIKVLSAISYDNGTFEIGTPRQIVKEWVETRYTPTIRKVLEELVEQPIILKFTLLQENQNGEQIPLPSVPPITIKQISLSEPSPPPFIRTEENHSPLNPKYTFDSFVIGNSNRFAHAASLAVSEVPAKVYNPFFIYGGVGLGKNASNACDWAPDFTNSPRN